MRDYEAIKRSCQEHANHREFICEHFPKGGIGAEVGVLYGQFSEKILKIAKPQTLFLVDPWSHDDKYGGRTPGQMNLIYREVETKFVHWKNISINRVPSIVFFQWHYELDYIYIDGDHEYENVLSDLNGSYEIVRPGGIIAGDDYGENIPPWGNSIKRAVDDFCKGKVITPEIIDVPGENGKQFLIRR
jgi:hypothetical protein